jgi:hypothetical protein
MIDAASIPVIEGDMEALAMHARAVDAAGAAIADTGTDVDSTWQALRPVYRAPEAEQLFDATLVVKSVAVSTGEDIRTAAAALLHYSDEVRDIQARLTALQGRATEFEADMRMVDDPGSEQAYVDRNNELVSAVNVAMADFEDAQRRCANAINGLYRDGLAYRADDGDGVAEPGEFGATATQYDAVGAPWGRREPDAPPEDPGWLADLGHTALDVIGLVPVVGEAADGVNALWYTAEGDYLNAGLSAAAMIPVAGWVATGGKFAVRGVKAVHTADGARAWVKGRPAMVPWNAKELPFTPNGKFPVGERYEWKDPTSGKTMRYHAHGPDPDQPLTQNAGQSPIYRLREGNHYLDAERNSYTKNQVENPDSSVFSPRAANDTHIPYPTDQPRPDWNHRRVAVPNVAGFLGPDGSGE